MKRPFPAYEGEQPYVFVCYAHDDAAAVYPELLRLRRLGINVWYDEGVAPGSEWSDALARRIRGCAVFLYFVTPASVTREHCRREVSFLQSLEQAPPILAVHLDATNLPDGLALSLGNRQAILKYELGPTDYEARLGEAIRALRTGARAAEAPGGGIVAGREDPRDPRGDRIEFDAIAVLPFRDLSADQGLGSLAAVLTRQLTTRLEELPWLRVASVAAVERLARQELSLAALGAAVDVPTVISGHLDRAGDRVEAPVEIIRAADGRVLWSAAPLRTLGDSGVVARSLACEIFRFVGKVGTAPSPGPSGHDAYRAWLNWHYHAATMRDWQEIRWIEQVLQEEPEYTPARLDAFESYFAAALDGQDQVWAVRARQALDAAALDSDSDVYRTHRGRYLAYVEGDLAGAEPLFRAAGGVGYAGFLMDSGIPGPALKVGETQVAKRPYDPGSWLLLGFARGMDGDLVEALGAFDEGLRRLPDHPYLLLQHARAHTFLGDYDAAARSVARLEALGPLRPGGDLGLRENRYRLLGRTGDVAAALTGAAALAEEGWHATAASLFLEFGDPRADLEYQRAAEQPVAGRRMVASWLHPDPGRAAHPAVRGYLDALGFSAAWRQVLIERAADYAAGLGVELPRL